MDEIQEFIGNLLTDALWFVIIVAIIVGLLFYFGAIKTLVVKKTRGALFLFLGRAAYACITDDTRHFQADGFFANGPGEQSTGGCFGLIKWEGLVLYINGLVKPAEYADFNEKDDGFGDPNDKNLVVLHQQRKEITLDKVETASGTAVGLTIAVRMFPADLMRFLTESPTNVVKQTLGALTQLLLLLVKTLTVEQIHALKASGPDGLYRLICNSAEGQAEIDRLRNEWGMGIPCDGLAITDIRYEKIDQDAQAQSKRQKWEAEGVATELMESQLWFEAKKHGFADLETTRAWLLGNDPNRLDEIVAQATETMLERKLGAVGAHRTVKVKGLQGSGSLEQMVASAVTLFQGLAQQYGPKPDNSGKGKPKGGSKP